MEIEARLAAMERRIEELEAENTRLKPPREELTSLDVVRITATMRRWRCMAEKRTSVDRGKPHECDGGSDSAPDWGDNEEVENMRIVIVLLFVAMAVAATLDMNGTLPGPEAATRVAVVARWSGK
jgi:hypothetical protein